jgi:hypothetical protein
VIKWFIIRDLGSARQVLSDNKTIRQSYNLKTLCSVENNSMYSPQGFVKQLSNGKWGYELTLSYVVSSENDG